MRSIERKQDLLSSSLLSAAAAASLEVPTRHYFNPVTTEQGFSSLFWFGFFFYSKLWLCEAPGLHLLPWRRQWTWAGAVLPASVVHTAGTAAPFRRSCGASRPR